MSERRMMLTAVLVVVGAVFGAVIVNVGRGGPTASLKDKNPAMRVAAIRAMGGQGDDDMLIDALRDESADVRLLAAGSLGGSGSEGEKRAAALVGALKDPHAGVRRMAAESLRAMGSESAPALIQALTDPDPRVRAGAALAIGDVAVYKVKRGRAPDEVQTITPLLNKLLTDEDAEVRRNAAHTLEVLRRVAR